MNTGSDGSDDQEIGREEEDAEMRAVLDRLERLFPEEPPHADDPSPLRVGGGVDGEHVAFLSEFDQQCFTTDVQGRIVELCIVVTPEHDLSFLDILPRLADLQHLERVRLYSVGEEPFNGGMTDEALLHLSGWKQVVDLEIGVRYLTGRGFEELVQRNGFPRLQRLSLTASTGADPAIASIARCPDLREVDLCGCDLTDSGVRSLAGLERIKELKLSSTRIVGHGFARAAYGHNLHRLDVTDCPVSDLGLAEIGNLSGLRSLKVSSDEVTDAGLAHLTRLADLELLCLAGCKISVEGLRLLSSLGNCRELWIPDTPIGDEAVQILAEMELNYLWATDTLISKQGFARLECLLPRCQISR